jgi:hypothetical protein
MTGTNERRGDALSKLRALSVVACVCCLVTAGASGLMMAATDMSAQARGGGHGGGGHGGGGHAGGGHAGAGHAGAGHAGAGHAGAGHAGTGAAFHGRKLPKGAEGSSGHWRVATVPPSSGSDSIAARGSVQTIHRRGGEGSAEAAKTYQRAAERVGDGDFKTAIREADLNSLSDWAPPRYAFRVALDSPASTGG